MKCNQVAFGPGPGRGRGWRPAAAAVVVILTMLAGMLPLSGQAADPAAKVAVAASIIPLGDFCRQIGGDRVDVAVVIPPGASPHVFEPQPSVVARAMAARVFVFVGAGLDPWAERLLRSRGTQKLTVVEAAAGLPLVADVDHQAAPAHPGRHPEPGHKEKKEEHAHATGNPHVWLDPVLAQDICRRIARALIEADPAHRVSYEANLARYLTELDSLHRELEAALAAFRIKAFVSFHPSFTYFAKRYGLVEAGVIELAPGREPTPRHIQRLVAAIRKHQVQVVFGEPQLSPRVAQVVAQEAGVKVLVLDPLGGFPPYGSDYLKLMRHNLAVMQQVMR